MSMGTLTQTQPISLSCQLTPPKGAKVIAPSTSRVIIPLSGISKVSRSTKAATMSTATVMSYTIVIPSSPNAA